MESGKHAAGPYSARQSPDYTSKRTAGVERSGAKAGPRPHTHQPSGVVMMMVMMVVILSIGRNRRRRKHQQTESSKHKLLQVRNLPLTPA